MMLAEGDGEWLADAHPGLLPDCQGVSGIIAFWATYDPETDLFIPLGDSATGDAKGRALYVSFRVHITERSEKVNSALPAVHLGGVDPTVGRHFCQRDKSACLCSPFVENDYLLPHLNFRKFIEDLVLPFLYGQAFYTLEQRWPWAELAHGAMGILESYRASEDRQTLEKCLGFLQREPRIWRRVLVVARQQVHLKGNMQCFCGSKTKLEDCHPRALEGAIGIRRDMRSLGLMFH